MEKREQIDQLFTNQWRRGGGEEDRMKGLNDKIHPKEHYCIEGTDTTL